MLTTYSCTSPANPATSDFCDLKVFAPERQGEFNYGCVGIQRSMRGPETWKRKHTVALFCSFDSYHLSRLNHMG